MRRYIDTFFHYLIITLIPIIVLPAVEFMLTHHSSSTVTVTQNITVDNAISRFLPSYNQYLSVAQNEQSYLQQFLAESSFDTYVIARSPAFVQAEQMIGHTQLAQQIQDLQKNIQIIATGPELVSISFTGMYEPEGGEIVPAFVAWAAAQTSMLGTSTAVDNVSYEQGLVNADKATLKSAYNSLTGYMKRKHIRLTLDDLGNLTFITDVNLNDYYQQYQNALKQFNSDELALTQAQSQRGALSHLSTGASSVYGSGLLQLDGTPTVIYTSGTKKVLMNVGIALLVALLIGGAFLVIRTVQDRTIRYADEVPELLGLPVLLVVPHNPVSAGITPARSRGLLPRRRLANT